MTSNLPARLPGAGALALPDAVARRTAELTQQDQPVIVWQRAVGPGSKPVVSPSLDAVIVGGARIGIRSGQPVPAAPPGLHGRCVGFSEQGEVRIVKMQTADGMVYLAGIVPGSGEILWRRSPVPWSEYMSGRWGASMSPEHAGADPLIAHGSGTGEWLLELLDPATGRSTWKVPWPGGAGPGKAGTPEYQYDEHGELRQVRGTRDGDDSGNARHDANGSGRVRLARIRDSIKSGTTAGLAGVDETDGTVLWRIRYPPAGGGHHWCRPVFLGSEGRCLVLAGAIAAHGEDSCPAVPVGKCSCRDGGAPDPGEPNICTACGGIFRPWATVAVHDRLTGRRLWGRRWPDRADHHKDPADVADMRGGVLLTWEGRFLRAWSVEDGRQLWSAVPPQGYGRFAWPGRRTASQWAWAYRPAEGVRSPRASDLFIHAPTGRSLAIGWALHQTDDDLVLTYADGMLTCLALPGSPALRQPAPVAAPPGGRLDWRIDAATGWREPKSTNRSIERLSVTVTVTAISSPACAGAAPERLTADATGTAEDHVWLRIRPADRVQEWFVRQITPSLEYLIFQQALGVEPTGTADCPTGAWSQGDSREYEIVLGIPRSGQESLECVGTVSVAIPGAGSAVREPASAELRIRWRRD